MKKPFDNTLIWFGWNASTGRPLLERVEKNQCRECKGFGTYGNPLCGAVYLCGRCKGTGHNPGMIVQLHQLWQKIVALYQKAIDFLKK